MVLRAGDKYRCTNPMCGCEVLVARIGSAVPIRLPHPPSCTCGHPMKEGWARPTWIPSLRRGMRLRVN